MKTEGHRNMEPEPMDLSEGESSEGELTIPQKNRKCTRCYGEKLTPEDVMQNMVTCKDCRQNMQEKKQEFETKVRTLFDC